MRSAAGSGRRGRAAFSTARSRAADPGATTVRDAAGACRRGRARRARPRAARAEKVQVSRVLTWTLATFLAPLAIPGRTYSSQAWMIS
ncbi:hypothetical protein GCM10010503_56220 [Streptomyces lucensis JCM 4490]|uniref:Uncharacterized protein n=1 Tax=Streptomyces lucensis JCM 4490 TaxID=1306176 RepID=A0A918JBR7_9ACTN|nr:hypothetical protein [Streptomyces lucensis]GGW71543.1 hypothetical protein GCM10010503_56220 [Streptomyces lucensis JCM 4490]